MTKYIFFSGKGGVGKTTMASATAIHYAMSGKRTLIVTTDPASNLADVFEQNIGHRITQIEGIDALYAMEIDSDEAAREYRERIISPFREIMPEDVIASLEEQFNSPCTTEIASFDRFVDFMDSAEYDVIVFDTAPTGHTIRLLELPVDWSKHIAESMTKGSGQTCLGPVQAIQEAKDKYDTATMLLRNTERTRFVFVMRPEELSLYETVRASGEIAALGIKSNEIIVNGILPEQVCENQFFRKKYEAQRQVIKRVEESMSEKKHYMSLRDNEVKGIDALRDAADELFNNKRPVFGGNGKAFDQIGTVIERPDLDSLLLPGEGTKTLFFTGKGGVGKTVISCITALHVARKGFKTLLVTTDPAAHIGQVLDRKILSEPTEIEDNLFAMIIDQKAAFIQYKERILNEAREKYSADMFAVLEEELNSPCTEEMAAFDRFTQFLGRQEYDVIIFDTAPTGHTLRLLELPFDYAKQVEMMISTGEGAEAKRVTQERFKGIIEMLRDRERTIFCLVFYPELTPIMESYRAMLDFRAAGIETQLLVANMILPEEVCTNDFFKSRRLMQMKYLTVAKDMFNLPIFQFPLLQDEMKGVDALGGALTAYEP